MCKRSHLTAPAWKYATPAASPLYVWQREGESERTLKELSKTRRLQTLYSFCSRHRSGSRSRSRRQLQFRTSSFTRRLTRNVHSSSWSSWLHLLPLCSSFSCSSCDSFLFFGGLLCARKLEAWWSAAAAAKATAIAIAFWEPSRACLIMCLLHPPSTTFPNKHTYTMNMDCHCLLWGFKQMPRKYLRSMFWHLLFALIKPTIFVSCFDNLFLFLPNGISLRNALEKETKRCVLISQNWIKQFK